MFKTNGKLGENLLRTLLEFFKKKKKINSKFNTEFETVQAQSQPEQKRGGGKKEKRI